MYVCMRERERVYVCVGMFGVYSRLCTYVRACVHGVCKFILPLRGSLLIVYYYSSYLITIYSI